MRLALRDGDNVILHTDGCAARYSKGQLQRGSGMREFLMSGLVALALCLAQAGVIFDNAASQSTVYNTSDTDAPYRIADDFSLSNPASAVAARFWGAYFPLTPPAPSDTFTLNFYADTGGKPGALVATRTPITLTRTPVLNLFVPDFRYDATFADVSLAGNTTYWLSIVDDATGTDGSKQWGWRVSIETGGHCWQSVDAGATWSNNFHNEMAFQLMDIPEPAGAVMLGIVPLVLTVKRRERQRPADRRR